MAAVNGGYILNAELVGKLGLTEDFIGTPLGLVIKEGDVRSLPLFNRPVLVTKDDGSIFIKRVKLPGGRLRVKGQTKWLAWTEKMIDPDGDKQELAVYTPGLERKVPLTGRVLVTVGYESQL